MTTRQHHGATRRRVDIVVGLHQGDEEMVPSSLVLGCKGIAVLCAFLPSTSAWLSSRCPRTSGDHHQSALLGFPSSQWCRPTGQRGGGQLYLSAPPKESSRGGREGEDGGSRSSKVLSPCMPRRSLFDACAAAPFISFSMPFTPALAVDKDEGTAQPTADDEPSSASNGARNRVANLLHAIPTFCIVDPKGVPYVVVGDDAKVTGYFFTRYGEADRILKLARTSADRAIKNSDERNVVNPWKSARISSVPLDVAATLVTKTLASRTHFQIAPAESDIEAALNITGKSSLAEGKVPLFYYEDWKDSNNQSQLFFGRDQLEQVFVKSENLRGGASLPQPNVTELFAVLTQVVQNPNDAELQTLVLVAPDDSAVKARACERNGGSKEPPFVVGQQILVL